MLVTLPLPDVAKHQQDFVLSDEPQWKLKNSAIRFDVWCFHSIEKKHHSLLGHDGVFIGGGRNSSDMCVTASYLSAQRHIPVDCSRQTSCHYGAVLQILVLWVMTQCCRYTSIPWTHGTEAQTILFPCSDVPRNFVHGGVQQIQLRTEDRENGDMGAVAP